MHHETETASPASSRVPTGVRGLDDVLHGGLPAGNLYLIEGRPGTGKTTLALQFLLTGARSGERVVYISFSESHRELATVATSHGWSLDTVRMFDLGEVLTQQSAGDSSIFHPADFDLPLVLQRIYGAVEQVGPSRAVLDSLTELRNLAESAREYRRLLLQIKRFLEQHGVTTILIDEAGHPAASEAESLVHGVILLDQRTPSYGPMRRRLEVCKLRGSTYEAGFHDFTIEGGGVRVFPRLRTRDGSRHLEGSLVTSGVPELDALLGGGLDRGMAALIAGPTGVGKSSIATQFAIARAQAQERAVVFTFDEDPKTCLRRATNLGMPLARCIDDGWVVLRSVDAAELSPGQFADLIRTEVERHDAAMIVLDSINGYLQAMPEESALVPHMHDLLMFLGRRGVVMLMVMTQTGMLDTTKAPIEDVSYLADTVLLLRYFEASGAVRKSISTVKNRTAAHENLIREFEIGATGLRLGQPISTFENVLAGIPTFRGQPETLLASRKTSDAR